MKVKKGSRVGYDSRANALMVDGKAMRTDLMKKYRSDGVISYDESKRMQMSGVHPRVIRLMREDLKRDRQRIYGGDEFITTSGRRRYIQAGASRSCPTELKKWEDDEIDRRCQVEADIKQLKDLNKPIKSRDMEFGRF